MVKDSAGSHDGWFWSNPVKGQCVVDNHRVPVRRTRSRVSATTACAATPPTRSPGRPATADVANEFTFASLRNIAGFPGEPILFRVDDSWRRMAEDEPGPQIAPTQIDAHPHPRRVPTPSAARADRPGPTPASSNLFGADPVTARTDDRRASRR